MSKDGVLDSSELEMVELNSIFNGCISKIIGFQYTNVVTVTCFFELVTWVKLLVQELYTVKSVLRGHPWDNDKVAF